nr:hypothetical protein [uncultured Blautia sp.]
MSNQRKILHDSNGLDYVLVGDYYLLNVNQFFYARWMRKGDAV